MQKKKKLKTNHEITVIKQNQKDKPQQSEKLSIYIVSLRTEHIVFEIS